VTGLAALANRERSMPRLYFLFVSAMAACRNGLSRINWMDGRTFASLHSMLRIKVTSVSEYMASGGGYWSLRILLARMTRDSASKGCLRVVIS